MPAYICQRLPQGSESTLKPPGGKGAFGESTGMTCNHCRLWSQDQFERCPNCGAPAPSGDQSRMSSKKVAAVYSGILIGWAVLSLFLTPIIIKAPNFTP